MGPCLTWCLGVSDGLGTCSSVEGSVDLSSPSSRNCLGALALSHITSAWGRSGVSLEVNGITRGCLEHACKYGAPKWKHYTNAFQGCCQNCNISRPRPHVNYHDTHDYRPPIFEKIPDHEMGVGTYNGREFQGCKVTKVIWEGWQLQVG